MKQAFFSQMGFLTCISLVLTFYLSQDLVHAQTQQDLTCDENRFQLKRYELLGCGSGKNPEEARLNARIDIARKIQGDHVELKSFILENCNDNEGIIYCDRKEGKEVKEYLNATLYDWRELKLKALDYGIYQAILAYDNRPFFEKAIPKFDEDLKCQKEQPKNRFLQNLFDHNNLPSNFQMKLVLKEQNYMLACGESFMFVRSISDLFYSQHSDLKLNQTTFNHGDEITIHIKNQSPQYFTLLYVDGKGNVGIFDQNLYKEKDFVYPDEQDPDILTVAWIKPTKGNKLTEMLIMLKSQKPIDQLNFEEASDQPLQAKLNFIHLINLLDQYEYETLTFDIFP